MKAWAPLLALLLAACTPGRNSIQPYAQDPVAAAALNELAAARCVSRTGTVPARAFTTDGCSMFPDGDWQQCCIAHDMDYWCGGSAEQRLRVDRNLQTCVRETGHPLVGSVMLFGSRLGGHPAWPFPWRWGYGDPWPAQYPTTAP